MSKQAQSGDVIEKRYRLESQLGAGGMGAVWLATQLMVDRPVAVKLLHHDFIDQEDLQARFEVEAKAIGKLNHPNVVTLYDFGFSEELDSFYTVIEYIDGVSLDKRLNERMPLAEVTGIIRQVALALDHAHHHGILHRDLKPENVMLATMTDGSQIAKVLDFGIARIVKGTYEVESPESQRITKAGEVFGTPAYMSPEQARSIRRLTPASDLYALGIMFYELVAGRLPFFAKSAFDLLMLHVTKPVPPISRPDVPRPLIDIIFRLLDKDPDNRFQTGAELARAIESVKLPEPGQPSQDDFDQYDTIVNSKSTPTFAHSPTPVTHGHAEQNQSSAQFALPTPSAEFPSYTPSNEFPRHSPSDEFPQYSQSNEFPQYSQSNEYRASTVMMGEGTGERRIHDTLRDDNENRLLLFAAGALLLLVFVALGLVVVALSGGKEDQVPRGEVIRKATQTPGSEEQQKQGNKPPPEKREAAPEKAPLPDPGDEPGRKPPPDGETDGEKSDGEKSDGEKTEGKAGESTKSTETAAARSSTKKATKKKTSTSRNLKATRKDDTNWKAQPR